jgi:hypothetical protein
MKSRNNTYGHNLFDSVRGGTKRLVSNLTDAEQTVTGGVNSFNTNGMTIQNDATYANINASATTYIGWQWRASGSTVSNTSGTITSTVSSNTTAGFSVVGYTGTGANATVGHGLGVAPNMILFKSRISGAANWIVYHSSIGNTQAVFLNQTAAASTSSTYFNNTSPTSSVMSIGTASLNNSGEATIAYCFAAVSGYSAFGTYTGNGSTDGPFVFTNFRPCWVMVKKSSATGNWLIFDTSRSPYNVQADALFPNLSNAETTTTSYNNDFLSNGFKIRTLDGSWNDSGVTYIYAAFAENPFTISRAR